MLVIFQIQNYLFTSCTAKFHFTFLFNPVIHLFLFYFLPSFLSSSKRLTHSFSQVHYLLLLSSSFPFHNLSETFLLLSLSFALFIIPIISLCPRFFFISVSLNSLPILSTLSSILPLAIAPCIPHRFSFHVLVKA